jgi:hypothetical protein
MSHVYVITSAAYTPGPADPQVTVSGTVDGIPVTVQVWLSAVTAAGLLGNQALKNLVAPLMLAAAIVVSPPAPVAPVQLATGTFTQ